MSYPTVSPAVLTESQQIDAMVEAEAGIIQCMAKLFCPDAITPTLGLAPEIATLPRNIPGNVQKRAQLIKDVLSTYACKEYSIADLVNSAACKLAIDNGIINNNSNGGNSSNNSCCGK